MIRSLIDCAVPVLIQSNAAQLRPLQNNFGMSKDSKDRGPQSCAATFLCRVSRSCRTIGQNALLSSH